MTREEAIAVLQIIKPIPHRVDGKSTTHALKIIAIDMAIKALEQEPCEDAISREDALQALCQAVHKNDDSIPCSNQRVSCLWNKTKVQDYAEEILKLPPVTPQQKTGHCKDCKYFEYDSVVKVDGSPLIVAHEICSRWGNGCKTREDGYCFLFEPQESEGKTWQD